MNKYLLIINDAGNSYNHNELLGLEKELDSLLVGSWHSGVFSLDGCDLWKS